MRRFFVPALCVPILLAWMIPANTTVAASPARYLINDAGQLRSFELALDEVSVSARGKREFRQFAAQADEDGLRRHVTGLQRAAGGKLELVLYEAGVPRNDAAKRIVTERLLLRVHPGADVAALAAAAGAVKVTSADYAPGYYVLEIPGTGETLPASKRLRARGGVISAEPLLARRRWKRWIPNDPLFAQQWHLRNAFGGMDIAVTNTWDTYRGTGIYIGIIDDGLQLAHPDIAPNAGSTWHYDFNEYDTDPSPDYYYGGYLFDAHGTCCAGLAAGRGNNAVGISGVAPMASLVGLRLTADYVADDQEAAAMMHSNTVIQVKSCSWGPIDDAMRLEGPGPLTAAALEHAAWYGRGGRGIIFTWAGGNGGTGGDDVNYDGYANSMYTIAIAALSNNGVRADYSETGACIVVSAPAGGGTNGVVTSDLTGEDGYNYTGAGAELADIDYTRLFAGTSASTPVAAGVIALILEANPNLGWRDVQEILMRTARQVDIAAGGWRTNSGGFKFSHRYGAGMISASNAVATALTWSNLKPRQAIHVETNFNRAVPDNNAVGISSLFVITNRNLRVEHVQVEVDVTHPLRGQLSARVVSPAGHTSALANAHSDTNANYSGWTFMSVQSWGEHSTGTWRVVIADRQAGSTGTWTRAKLSIHGVPTSSTPPSIRPVPDQIFALNTAASFQVLAEDADGQPVTLTASNLPAGTGFVAVGGTGTFTWASASPVGVYTSWFYATDNVDGITTQRALMTVSAPGVFSFREPFFVADERFPYLSIDVDRLGGFGGVCGVHCTTRDGTAVAGFDYEGLQDVVEFYAGGTNRQIFLTILDDPDAEGHEYFQLVITNALPGAPGNIATANVVIVDDDIMMTTKLYTDFTGGLPAGWTNTSASGFVYWRFDDPSGWGNLTGGTGTFAIADSDWAGMQSMDVRLHTPVLDFSDCLKADLQFRHDFYYYSGAEYGDVDISTNGLAGPWENIWWIGGYDANGLQFIDLTPHVAGKANVMIRFRYWNAFWDYWWQLDNIRVRGEIDSDADGLPDWWELQKFGLLTNTATGDRDLDNSNNMDEYWADTNPADNTSLLEIVGIRPGNPAVVTFIGSPLRSYRLVVNTNLAAPDWVAVNTNAAGAALADVSVTNHLPSALYRIQANAPP